MWCILKYRTWQQKAILALSALARAMKEMNNVRCVWRQGQILPGKQEVLPPDFTPNPVLELKKSARRIKERPSGPDGEREEFDKDADVKAID
uniref:Uncharacterized protein n=1 Tax=Solanum lycopersicum TaxID=4081 RepID=A0A3Q7EL85_SOLLC